MALVKCPDCEKMVSSRAPSCPFCGCPAEYFEEPDNTPNVNNTIQVLEKQIEKKITDNEAVSSANIINTVNETSNQSSVNELMSEYEADDEEDIEEAFDDDLDDSDDPDDVFESFSIFGESIVYPQKYAPFIKIACLHNNNAAIAERSIISQYKDAKSLDNVIDNVIPMAQGYVDKIIEHNLKYLYQDNIYISLDEFRSRYELEVIDFMEGMFNEYSKVIEKAEAKQVERSIDRSNRSYWTGGGFGIRGAVKGAIKAGAMNAVTGIGRSIGDGIVDSGDRAAFEKDKKKIYENQKYRNQLCHALRNCILRADLGLLSEIHKYSYFEDMPLDPKKANNIIDAANKFSSNNSEKYSKYIDAIKAFPLSPEMFKPLVDNIIYSTDDDFNELVRLLDFWNMNEDYAELFTEAEKKKKVEQYFDSNPDVLDVDFNDFTPDTYKKLKGIRKDLLKLTDGVLPKYLNYCRRIPIYFNQCMSNTTTLSDVEILNNLNENTSLENFLGMLISEKEELPDLMTSIDISGDGKRVPKDRLVKKWGIPESDTVIFYQNKAIFGTAFGGKGFVLTDTVVCDLSSKQIIPLRMIDNIKYNTSNKNIEIAGNSTVLTISMEDEKYFSGSFLKTCIEYIVMNYITLTDEERHNMFVNDCANRIMDTIQKYVEANNIDENEDILKDFLIKQGVIPDPSLKMFCIFCGKSIYKTVKFCNFCGAVVDFGEPEVTEEQPINEN